MLERFTIKQTSFSEQLWVRMLWQYLQWCISYLRMRKGMCYDIVNRSLYKNYWLFLVKNLAECLKPHEWQKFAISSQHVNLEYGSRKQIGLFSTLSAFHKIAIDIFFLNFRKHICITHLSAILQVFEKMEISRREFYFKIT